MVDAKLPQPYNICTTTEFISEFIHGQKYVDIQYIDIDIGLVLQFVPKDVGWGWDQGFVQVQTKVRIFFFSF